MMALARQPLTTTARVRAARRWLNEGSEAPCDAVDEVLARSWLRSRHAGLVPDGRLPGAPHASAAQLARALQRQYELVAHARPVMEYIVPHIGSTESLFILADAAGMLLHTLGDAAFASRAERVALRPGACWQEQYRGTNAIGTALAEAAPMVVHGGEHYLQRNGFLTCAAAPIFDPSGALLGVLNISGEQRGYHPHTLGLARSAARMVEHRLFDTRHASSVRLHLHAQIEGLGTLTESLIALSEDGWVIGANATALETFGLPREAIGSTRLESLVDTDMATLLDAASRPGGPPRGLPCRNGTRLWARVDAGRLSVNSALRPAAVRGFGAPGGVPALQAPGAHARQGAAATGTGAQAQPGMSGAVGAVGVTGLAERGPVWPDWSDGSPRAPRGPAVADALSALETGDATLGAAARKARRVLDKPIAILLQGESGTGKEVFARALHASGARHAAPFVAVNCAALPETLIEAELFGYRPGAFTGAHRDGAPGRIREAHGGTLFLDEIGDMPLALQARLLRVIQEREVVPLGGGKPQAVDFRLVCATHRNLRAEMDAGRFREDLYYRLNGLALHLPPLRERSDLAALVERMLEAQMPGAAPIVGEELTTAMQRYRWPGNLRQLHNALTTACALLDEGEAVLGWAHLPDDLAAELRAAGAGTATGASAGCASNVVAAGQSGVAEVAGERGGRVDGERDADAGTATLDLRVLSQRTVHQAVEDSAGNLSEAARRLGISRNTLYRRLKEPVAPGAAATVAAAATAREAGGAGGAGLARPRAAFRTPGYASADRPRAT